MTTLTYGTLPNYTELQAAFNKNVAGDEYRITSPRSSTDCYMLDELSLYEFGRYCCDEEGVDMWLNSAQLYDLCEALCELWDNEAAFMRDSEQCNWAGDFCSSILSTLGYEWV